MPSPLRRIITVQTMAPVVISSESSFRIYSVLPVICGGQKSDSARDSSHRPTSFEDLRISFFFSFLFFTVLAGLLMVQTYDLLS